MAWAEKERPAIVKLYLHLGDLSEIASFTEWNEYKGKENKTK
jgi:hypothetical protein